MGMSMGLRKPKSIKHDGKKLTAILESHELFFRGKDGGARADLTGADLSNADLSGVNLTGVILRNANLEGLDLKTVWLLGADLSGDWHSIVGCGHGSGHFERNGFDRRGPFRSGFVYCAVA